MDLSKSYFNCQNCNLSNSRNNIVFGTGNNSANVVFVGEAPGKNEDIRGEPFVGAAGNLLNKFLKHIQLSREDIYITNIVKCRPPNNRNPLKKEIKACSEILNKEITLMSPKVIVPLGLFATKFFLNLNKNIGDLRGQIFIKNNYIIFPLYHPAYLLRNPNDKKTMLNDFIKLKSILNNNTLVDKTQNL